MRFSRGNLQRSETRYPYWYCKSCQSYFNVSSTNSEQSKLCVYSPLYIDTQLLWK
ncbi:hypothetical protein HMPREF1199_01371 [Hoylesella oralis CC98A]|nr:hypothetical protein HMPREF1199_01371 [Hoylesella oralis CC98A]